MLLNLAKQFYDLRTLGRRLNMAACLFIPPVPFTARELRHPRASGVSAQVSQKPKTVSLQLGSLQLS